MKGITQVTFSENINGQNISIIKNIKSLDITKN